MNYFLVEDISLTPAMERDSDETRLSVVLVPIPPEIIQWSLKSEGTSEFNFLQTALRQCSAHAQARVSSTAFAMAHNGIPNP